jgi:hypothetical protein
MGIAPLSIRKDYWLDFQVTDQDLDFLYNHLLEIEQPLTTRQIVKALIAERIREERVSLEKQQLSGGSIYYPKDHFKIDQEIQFPGMNWLSGKVAGIRPGQNPEIPPFEVIEVEMSTGEKRQFAAGLEEHKLNQPLSIDTNDPLLNVGHVFETYGEAMETVLLEVLVLNDHLVRIAGRWFPRALLVDINVGHLNLAEAVLDMMEGGPLDTRSLMEQIDLPSDANANLNEFSLNLALQEDKRFDEVGPSGEILWYLHRLEPEPVREIPVFLRYQPSNNYNPENVISYFDEIDEQVFDEHEPVLNASPASKVQETIVSLIYPHWRVGTLPLTGSLARLFPTAIESPRIQFTLVDGISGEKFSGWVVRPFNYVYGLRDWYLSQGLIPGSVVRVLPGKNPGEVIVRAEKKRPTREWVRTAVVGSDGGIVFSMLKHNITSSVDERMGIVVPNTAVLDEAWEHNRQRGPLEKTVRPIMRELAKLNPQNHVHAQELYAAVNIVRRSPPGPILTLLLESPWAKHLGNLYFRLEETSGEETT